MPEPLRIESADDRVVATLARPEVRNAIDQAMIDALHDLCADLEATPRFAACLRGFIRSRAVAKSIHSTPSNS